ncbi:sodium channel subunit beta-3-like isoform X2 [Poecilia formosa]|uniref:sodium channel subunit beta-3-like isoform X2 n=1 Tax=Poecilia formosa TaxID=48698 RepID=UPI0007B7D296|nr:PREDICTED: sodium channel subunit beta-3-like isoform X2 [Poecilia formosa]
MRNCEPRSCKFIEGLVKPLKKRKGKKRKEKSLPRTSAERHLTCRLASFLSAGVGLEDNFKTELELQQRLSHQQLLIGLNMLTLHRVQQQTLLLLLFVVHLSRPVCVDVASDTEAVLGSSMKLTCISCLKREELKPNTNVNWYFTSSENNTYDRIHIFESNKGDSQSLDGPFKDRLIWNGSKDLQDVSLLILHVTESDRGIYECHVNRTFEFGTYTPYTVTKKNITLTVKEKASNDTTAIYSEIMMYVLLVFLTLWLLVEMVYCYRKISKSDEQVQDTAY